MKPAAEPALFSNRPNRHPVHGHDGQEPLARRPPGRLWHQVPDAADALCVHTAGLSLTTVSSQERNAAPSQGQTERTSRTTNHSCTCTRTCASAGGTGASTNTTRRPSVAPSGTAEREGEEEAKPHLRWRSLLIQLNNKAASREQSCESLLRRKSPWCAPQERNCNRRIVELESNKEESH